MGISDFLALVLSTIKDFGGLPMLLKVSAVITVLISSLKVAPISRVVWSRLGWAQVLLAPVLGLLAGILSLAAAGTPITLSALLAYLTAGAGAVFLHELLDGVKAAPGIGKVYVTAIDWIESLLAPSSPAPAAASAKSHPTLEDSAVRGKFL